MSQIFFLLLGSFSLDGVWFVEYVTRSLHSFIFKLCIMIVPTVNICILYYVIIFIIYFGVLNLEIITSKPPLKC